MPTQAPIYQDVDWSDTLSITKAWLADREALIDECVQLRNQRNAARNWARWWKCSARIWKWKAQTDWVNASRR